MAVDADLMLINLSAVQRTNYVNGPGRRFVIWVQGCHLGCPQCWNKHTWSFAPKIQVSVGALFAQISEVEKLDGVTLTGGEPLLQPRPLAHLAERIKSELNLSLQIFTGFEMCEIKGTAQKKLLSMADVVVTGRYNPDMPNNGQTVHNFGVVHWAFNNTDVEAEISPDGTVLLTGYPDDELISDIKQEAS